MDICYDYCYSVLGSLYKKKGAVSKVDNFL
jgi:hypothetical protein